MRRIWSAFVLSLAAVVLAGCGNAKPAIDPAVQGQLVGDVDKVKAAASSRDRAAAEEALAGLHRRLASAQAQGQLAPSKAETLLSAIARVSEDVRTIPLPAPEPPRTVTVPTPVPEDQQDEREDRAKEQEQEREQEKEQKREEAQEKRDENKGKENGRGNDDN